jgi:hypothetical protein
MHDLQNETYDSINASLEIAIRCEENLNYECQLLWTSGQTVYAQTYEYETIANHWRTQKDICERLAKLLWNLNPKFTDERFNSADLAGNGVSHLRTYTERLQMGCLHRAKARP